MMGIAIVLLVLLVPAGAARAQMREPSCVTFSGLNDSQREYLTLGMLGGFYAATTLAQRAAAAAGEDAAKAPGAREVSNALTATMTNAQGRSARSLAAELRQACTLGKYLGSPANLALLDLLLAAKPRRPASAP
jgi:hypothetical protein